MHNGTNDDKLPHMSKRVLERTGSIPIPTSSLRLSD